MHKKIVLNPESNRFVKINSAKYKRLVKEGVIQVQTPEPAEEVNPLKHHRHHHRHHQHSRKQKLPSSA